MDQPLGQRVALERLADRKREGTTADEARWRQAPEQRFGVDDELDRAAARELGQCREPLREQILRRRDRTGAARWQSMELFLQSRSALGPATVDRAKRVVSVDRKQPFQ